ncbi:hypothetical protein BLS_001602 [Venturia inaequalis]|uniref:DUF7587 domain-containing protein n=1 Tax=Venturia inaequalis TaxID=5025 RepID=A0A8H3UJ06_VENIN|nr:hypothetical protein EG328_006802 [Venturia inaequalis]KAE9977144.1 hypothetical protein BLS_001602 [Venturia inaequalis]KAE9994696.1 hypothetical protein EG327_005142 [Venturia inaequalis]
MARPKQERKRPAQSKPEPRDGDGKTRSNNLSVEPSKLNTESKAEPAIEPEGKSKTTTDSELVTTLGSGNDSTQLSFTQYEPQLVRQTGLYPEDKQVRLEDSRRKTPIYLFRASRPQSGSGIEIRNGDSVKMVPRACIDGSAAHDNVYLIPNLDLMLNGHLHGKNPLQSEFSSWAASFSVAIDFWSRQKDPQARISVIDTRKYPETAIYHVPNLQEIGLFEDEYIHEYLVHGVVEGGSGSGYKSISWTETINNDFDTLIIDTHENYAMFDLIKPVSQDQTISPLTQKEIQAAFRIASKFGPEFIIPVVASLLSHKPRSWRRPKSPLASEDIQAIAEALKKHPDAKMEDYSKITNIGTDAVSTFLYEEIHQMNILLRLLAEHTRRDRMNDGKKSEKKGDEKQGGKPTKVDRKIQLWEKLAIT